MENVKTNSVPKTWLPLILGIGMLLIGFLNVLPHIMIYSELKENGLTYYPYTLEGYYDMANNVGARIKEVLEGNLFISDIDLYEYKKAPAFLPMASATYYAPFTFFPVTLTQVIVTADFLFPAIFFLLFFVLFYLISGGRVELSIVAALFISLYYPLAFQIPPPNLSILNHVINTINPFAADPEMHTLARRESFIPGIIPLLLTYIFLICTASRKSLWYPIFGGMAFALNAYTYPYHFLYISSVIGIFFISLVITKNWEVLKRMIFFGGVAIITAIPFILNYHAVTSIAHYADIFSRFGVIDGRHFDATHLERYVWVIFLSVVVYIWGRLTDRIVTSLVVISALLSAIVALNLQLIFGFSVQPDHWLNRAIVWPLAMAYFIIGFWTFDMLVRKYGKKAYFLIGTFSVVILLSITLNSIRATEMNSSEIYHAFTLPQYTINLISWLNENTNADDVVMSPSLITNTYVVLYTHNKIFIPRALNSIASDDEMFERLYTTYSIYKISASHLERILKSDTYLLPFEQEPIVPGSDTSYETAGSIYLFSHKYLNPQNNETLYARYAPPDAIIKKLVDNYKIFACDQNCIKKYRIDYIVYGPNEKRISNINLEENTNLSLVATDGETSVYKVIH